MGHSSVANAHFSPSACSGLWLLGANHGNSGSLGAVPYLAMTVINKPVLSGSRVNGPVPRHKLDLLLILHTL